MAREGALTRMEGRAMAHPHYPTTDAVALTLAVVLAAAIVLIGYFLMPEMADLMMPPVVSGAY
jgi:hypothetical protein